MNKAEYLERLRKALSSVPAEERESAMTYYEEFFSDAGADNEQAVIASLGAPEALAEAIIRENVTELTVIPPQTDGNDPPPQNGGYAPPPNTSGFTPPPTGAQVSGANRNDTAKTVLLILVLIFTCPVWITVLSVVFALIVALYAAVFGIGVGFAAAGVSLFAASFAVMAVSGSAGFMMIGVSLILLGLLPLAVYPLFKLLIKGTASCGKGIASLCRKMFN